MSLLILCYLILFPNLETDSRFLISAPLCHFGFYVWYLSRELVCLSKNKTTLFISTLFFYHWQHNNTLNFHVCLFIYFAFLAFTLLFFYLFFFFLVAPRSLNLSIRSRYRRYHKSSIYDIYTTLLSNIHIYFSLVYIHTYTPTLLSQTNWTAIPCCILRHFFVKTHLFLCLSYHNWQTTDWHQLSVTHTHNSLHVIVTTVTYFFFIILGKKKKS